MVSTLSSTKEGIRDSLPNCVALFFIFISVGNLCNTQHMSFFASILMTLLIFAAPLQVVLIQSVQHDILLSTVLFTTLIINFRFLIISSTISSYFNKQPLFIQMLALFILSLSTFTVAYMKFTNDKHTDHFYYFIGVASATYIIAVLSTGLGYFITAQFHGYYIEHILAMIIPIYFTVLTAMNWPKLTPVIATLLGFISIPLIGLILPDKYGLLLGPVVIGIVFILIEKSALVEQHE